MNMEPKGYELLKIETKIKILEKELSTHFENLKKYEVNVCCLKLLETYRVYANKLKNNV